MTRPLAVLIAGIARSVVVVIVGLISVVLVLVEPERVVVVLVAVVLTSMDLLFIIQTVLVSLIVT